MRCSAAKNLAQSARLRGRGAPQIRDTGHISQPGSRVCSAPLRAALRAGHEASLPLRLRQEPEERRRLLVVAARFAGGRDLDPAVHALLAFLHGREIERLARLVGSFMWIPNWSKFSS